MAQVCGTCNRSWDDRATFCGVCGDRLGATLARPGDPPRSPRRRLPTRLLWSVLAVVVVVGAVLAVPAIQVERSSPVPGDIGVPDTDDLQAAGPADTGQDETRTDPPRATPPPNVSCTRDETPVGCVLWVRRMLDPGAQGARGLPPQATGDLLLTVENHTLRAFDTTTGRQRWQRQFSRPVESLHANDGVAIVHLGGQVQALSMDDSRVLWEADAIGPLHGPIVSDGLAYTADLDEQGPRLVAREAEDGAVVWEASTDEADFFNVMESSEQGVLVSTYDNELIFFDRDSGEQRWQADGRVRMLVHDDVIVFIEAHGDQDPEEPNRAGDPGAALQGIDLVTGDVRWHRELPALEVPFGLQGDLLLAPSSGMLTAVDLLTGQVRWAVETTEQEHAVHERADPPSASADDTVVTLGQGSGTLRGREASSGRLRWDYQPSSRAFGYAVLHEEVALVATPGGMDVVDPDTGAQVLRISAGADLHPIGAGPELLMDHRSGYAVRLDLDGASTLRGFP